MIQKEDLDRIEKLIEERFEKINNEIGELKRMISFIHNIQNPNICTDGYFHDYPNPWFATVPPPCKKCGKPAINLLATYITNTDIPYSTVTLDSTQPIIDLKNTTTNLSMPC